jgi:hypothetical protein
LSTYSGMAMTAKSWLSTSVAPDINFELQH